MSCRVLCNSNSSNASILGSVGKYVLIIRKFVLLNVRSIPCTLLLFSDVKGVIYLFSSFLHNNAIPPEGRP